MSYTVRAIRAELTKQRTVPAPTLLLALTLVALAGIGLAVVGTVDLEHCPPGGCPEDLARHSLTGTVVAQALAALLGVHAMGDEYAHSLVETTLVAMPRRGAVVLSKVTVTSLLVSAVAVTGVAGVYTIGRTIAPHSGFTTANGYSPLDLSDPTTQRAFGGTVLYLLLVAIIGLGVALLVRETAWATVVVLSMLYMIPVLTQFISDPSWERLLQRLSPSAGLAIQNTVVSANLPLTPWAGLVVTAAYAAVLSTAGTMNFIHRDP